MVGLQSVAFGFGLFFREKLFPSMLFHPEASWSDLGEVKNKEEGQEQSLSQAAGLRPGPPAQAPPGVSLLEGQGPAAGGGASAPQTPQP